MRVGAQRETERQRETDTHRRVGVGRGREGEKGVCSVYSQRFCPGVYQVRVVIPEILSVSIHIYPGCASQPDLEKSGALSRILEWDNSGPSL